MPHSPATPKIMERSEMDLKQERALKDAVADPTNSGKAKAALLLLQALRSPFNDWRISTAIEDICDPPDQLEAALQTFAMMAAEVVLTIKRDDAPLDKTFAVATEVFKLAMQDLTTVLKEHPEASVNVRIARH